MTCLFENAMLDKMPRHGKKRHKNRQTLYVPLKDLKDLNRFERFLAVGDKKNLRRKAIEKGVQTIRPRHNIRPYGRADGYKIRPYSSTRPLGVRNYIK